MKLKKLNPSEARINALCVEWLRLQLPDVIVHHSPNEGKRGWGAVHDVKSKGMMTGWPDLELFHAGRVLLVEIKRPGGVLSYDQKVVHALLSEQGFPVAVVTSLDEFRKEVLSWAKQI